MKLENQVVSLELAKKLKQLGVKQESLFYWCRHKNPEKSQTPVVITYQEAYENMFYIMASAFTVAELGEMIGGWLLPKRTMNGEAWISGDEALPIYVIVNCKTEADARAKMLIYLIENNLITI